MDSAWIGVIGVAAGSVLSLLGNFLTQYLSICKEERQWERQRISTKEDKQEEMIKQEREYLREVYYKCLLSLSVYMSKERENENAKKEDQIDLSEYEKEAHHWLSLLSLRCQDDKLDGFVDQFLENYNADFLRKYVLQLAKKEQKFFHSKLEISNDINAEKQQISNDTKTIIFSIDIDFIKQHIVETGVELPKSYRSECKLTKLTSTQREKLVEMCFKSGRTGIPKDLNLYLPGITQQNNNGQQVNVMNFQGQPWKAKLNPLDLTSNQILDHWVKDYDECYKVAQEKLNTSS